MRRLASVFALGAALALAACNATTPADDYHDYLERADRHRPDVGPDVSVSHGHFTDVTGNWFLRAALTAGLDLGLRVRMCAWQANPTEADWERCDPLTAPGKLMVRLWLEKQRIGVDAPLVETESVVDDAGFFVLRAEPLRLPADLVGSDIIAMVIMDAHITRDGAWCGDANGTVTQPPGLEIDGSTFAGTRDPDQTAKHFEVPFACGPEEPAPGQDAGPDAGPPPPDAAPVSEAGVTRPDSPDLSDVTSVAADLTGHWLVTAKLANGLALQLWLSLVYAGGAEGGTLDGAIHRTQDQPGAPAAATFTTTVTPDGRFDLWLPGFSMRTNLGQLEADILLSAATLGPEVFCGEGAGMVNRPISTPLAGATFSAVPYVPGTPPTPAAEAVTACPTP
jgi:hypothetical protein